MQRDLQLIPHHLSLLLCLRWMVLSGQWLILIVVRLKNSSKYKSNIVNAPSTPSSNQKNPGKTSEVSVVQSDVADKSSKGKKKGKGKSKSDNPKEDSKNSSDDDSSTRKPKYPCLICDDDHYTKDFPQCLEVSHILKGAPETPAIFKEPFPS